ncbi:hypothetical protein I5M32_16380 [Pedobacter sp. SD-b]|uniref:Uncharacterized protein n=1 Tax=Pedobacter segetis TaxID=2793069 RepID=A0ABS1BNR5_9SPHI|nr:hypothetical protein [Pedobacter segetis]MBK0384539.1 hypothetical protein [Pedobacter segetis]
MINIHKPGPIPIGLVTCESFCDVFVMLFGEYTLWKVHETIQFMLEI